VPIINHRDSRPRRCATAVDGDKIHRQYVHPQRGRLSASLNETHRPSYHDGRGELLGKGWEVLWAGEADQMVRTSHLAPRTELTLARSRLKTWTGGALSRQALHHGALKGGGLCVVLTSISTSEHRRGRGRRGGEGGGSRHLAGSGPPGRALIPRLPGRSSSAPPARGVKPPRVHQGLNLSIWTSKGRRSREAVGPGGRREISRGNKLCTRVGGASRSRSTSVGSGADGVARAIPRRASQAQAWSQICP